MHLGAIRPGDSHVAMPLLERRVLGMSGEDWTPPETSEKISCAPGLRVFGLQFSTASRSSCCLGSAYHVLILGWKCFSSKRCQCWFFTRSLIHHQPRTLLALFILPKSSGAQAHVFLWELLMHTWE